MGFSFLPKEYVFFDQFDALAAYCVEASRQFQEVVKTGSVSDEAVKKIKDLETDADKITLDIFEKLKKTFITPFDREDIHSLAHEIDSVVDIILKIINTMKIYQVTQIHGTFKDIARLVDKSIETLSKAIKGLRNLKDTRPVIASCAVIDQFESEGDHLRNLAIGELFSGGYDAIYIMKWKDIFQVSEKILDQCDDIAKIIESIIVKQA